MITVFYRSESLNKDNSLEMHAVKSFGFNDAAEWSSLAANDAPKEL
jgi:hypothetical protein